MDVPRGGIFEGAIVTGEAGSYWGPPVRAVQAVPGRVPVRQAPGFSMVGVAPYPRALGSAGGVWDDPLCVVNSNLPWCSTPAAVSRQIPSSMAAVAAAVAPQMVTEKQAAAAQNGRAPRGFSKKRPTSLEAVYQAETFGRGAGIFEGSVLQCPTAEGKYVPARGGIFDGPNFGEQCNYADRTRRTIPQASRPERPIELDKTVLPIGVGSGPDGLGRYIPTRW